MNPTLARLPRWQRSEVLGAQALHFFALGQPERARATLRRALYQRARHLGAPHNIARQGVSRLAEPDQLLAALANHRAAQAPGRAHAVIESESLTYIERALDDLDTAMRGEALLRSVKRALATRAGAK